MAPLSDLILYARPECSLCDEAREAIGLVLDDRRSRGLPVPELVERDIEADPELHRTYLERIPVVQLGDQRVELIVTVGKLRRLLNEVLGGQALDGRALGGQALGDPALRDPALSEAVGVPAGAPDDGGTDPTEAAAG